MKKLMLFFIATTFIANSFATTTIEPQKSAVLPNASQIMIPVGNSGKTISLLDLAKISRNDLETMTGKKMSFLERIAFKKTQKKLSKGISEDGTITNKRLKKFFGKRDGETGFHLGGFALGFFVGLIGVLIAYLIKDDYKRNRVKWAWIGWAIWVAVWVAILLAVA